MISSDDPVFCDYLDVTYSPEDSPISAIRHWLDSELFPVRYQDESSCLIDVGDGALRIEWKTRYHRVSASGSVLAYFRKLSIFSEYLSLLAMAPHKVTRLDAACDYPIDGPVYLRALEARYPDDQVNLQRKALRVSRVSSARASDGLQTGSWYAGHRTKARVTCRVYDKQAEALDVRAVTLPPTTRVEFTFRKDHGCTLRDAFMPYSLYHQFASPVLLEDVSDAPEWVPNGEGWTASPQPPVLPYTFFKRRLETSPEFARLVELATEMGPGGHDLLIGTFASAVRGSRSLGSQDSEATSDLEAVAGD